MTKIDIFSGFLGAGKTTLIQKLMKEAYSGEQLVLIENEFGEIGIDGGFLKDSGIEITEMNSGCICCSLVGDFSKALTEVLSTYHPDRILIEPSGVGKLSDVIRAVQSAELPDAELNALVTVADAGKAKMYIKNFGEFYNDQLKNAGCIVLSRSQNVSEAKLDTAVNLIRQKNADAVIITTPWDELTGDKILSAMEQKETIADELAKLAAEQVHHHDHEEHDEHCTCGCHDHDHEHDHEHHHEYEHDHEHEHEHHHDHDHDHEHHHEHDEHCSCGCHDHHHHHADEVFTSIGYETAHKFTKSQIESILEEMLCESKYGQILRAKGIVAGEDEWIHFDYVPGESNVRYGSADVIGKLCVIGADLNRTAIAALFGIEE